MSDQFKYLFTPIKIGTIEVRNRIVFGPHGTAFGLYSEDEKPEQYIEYQRTRAKGGCGLIVVSPEALMTHNAFDYPLAHAVIDHKRLVEKYKALSDAVHEHGAKILQQVMVIVGKNTPPMATPMAAWSFSGGPSTGSLDMTHEMTKEEIEEVIDGFVRYAVDAKEGGLDGVELHGSHGYILQQSWSPWGNQRRDEYGQMAFAFKMIERVRAAVGRDFVVGVRMSADDWMPGGLALNANQEIARKLEATGKIDYISLSDGSLARHYCLTIGAMHVPLAAWVPLQSGIRQVVKKIPVSVSSRINDPTLAEKILADGHGDLVAMVRALICDPELPNKAREGRLDDIRTCIACNQGCVDRQFARLEVRCSQNAAAGREHIVGEIGRATTKKKILVIGAGPGGMEAARVAALRGHQVLLFDKAEQLGGQVNLITKIPGRKDFEQVISWISKQIAKLGVQVKLRTEVTPELVKQEGPDAVILATGSAPWRSSLPGADRDNVVSIWDVVQHPEKAGKNVAVVENMANYESSYVIDHLLDLGKKVTLITPFPFPAFKVGFTNAYPLRERFYKKGLVAITDSSVKEIRQKSIVYTNTYTGEDREVGEIDTVLLAAGNVSNNGLYPALQGMAKQVHVIGDCVSHRTVMDAIREGFEVARSL